MSVSDYFSTFCSNLRMDSDTVSKIQSRYHQITKRINIDYWDSESTTLHSLYVGSYGRGTEIWTSDIDIIVQLPWSIYLKYDAYNSKGQWHKGRFQCQILVSYPYLTHHNDY